MRARFAPVLSSRLRGAVAAVVLVGGYFVANGALPKGIPAGILVIGLVIGMLNAMGAIGLILVYRAGRYVNFAQGAIGATGAVIAFRLIGVKHWNWWLAVLLGLVVATALAGLCELIFIERLFNASRLVLTIATIGIAQFATYFGLAVSSGIRDEHSLTGGGLPVGPPFDLSFSMGLVRFDSAYVLVLIVGPIVLAGLAWFLVRTRYGTVIDAGAQNVERARLVGISVRSLSTIIWLLVGFLGGLAVTLSAPVTSLDLGSAAGPTLLLYALAPAMIAGLDSFAIAIVAALALGVTQQAMAFNYTVPGRIQLVLFLVLAAALFVRRGKLGVGGRAADPPMSIGATIHPFPRELRRDPLLRGVRMLGPAVCLVLAVLIPLSFSYSRMVQANIVLVYLLAALSLVVLTGLAGQVSLGQWALVGFAGLFAGYLGTEYETEFVLGLVVVPILGMVLATLVGLPALQLRGILLGVVTLAFGVAASSYLFTLSYFRPDGFVLAPYIGSYDLSVPKNYYYVLLVVVVVALAVVGRLQRSAVGRNMTAVRDDPRAAAAMGIKVVRTKLIAFAVSGYLAALAGYLYLYVTRSLSGGQFTPDVSLSLFAAVIIGGAYSRIGAVIAALFLQGISQWLSSDLQVLVSSLGLLLILMIIPQGVSGVLFDARDRLLNWCAARRGITLSWHRDVDVSVRELEAEATATGEARSGQ